MKTYKEFREANSEKQRAAIAISKKESGKYDKDGNRIKEAQGPCWDGYEQQGMKKKGDRMVPNCVAEIYYENDLGESCGYTFEFDEQPMNEAEYQGRKVKLNKIMQGDVKKFKVYVKNDKGNVIKVEFGDTTGLKAKINDPAARKSFVARHKCETKNDKTKPGYWSCRLPWFAKALGLEGGGKFFW